MNLYFFRNRRKPAAACVIPALIGNDMAKNECIESIGQKPPFRYVDELVYVNRHTREARIALHLNRGNTRYGLDALQGFLLIEAMAQAGGVLLRSITLGEPGGYLVGLENARIPEKVASEEIFLDVSLKTACPPIFSFCVQAKSDSICIAESEIQIMSKRLLHGSL